MTTEKEIKFKDDEIYRLHKNCQFYKILSDQLNHAGQKLYSDLLNCCVLMSMSIENLSEEEIKKTPEARAIRDLINSFGKSLDYWTKTVFFQPKEE